MILKLDSEMHGYNKEYENVEKLSKNGTGRVG